MSRHQAYARCDGGVLLIVQCGHGAYAREHRFPMPIDEARILRDRLISAIDAAEKRCDPRRERIKHLRAEIEKLKDELGFVKQAKPTTAEGW